MSRYFEASRRLQRQPHSVLRPKRSLARRQIALPEDPHFLGQERASHAVQHTMVVEDGEIALLPINSVDEFGGNTRSLHPVHDLPYLLEIVDDGAVGQVQLLDGRGVDLQRQFARHRVLPGHGQDFDLVFLDGWEFRVWQFFAF